MWHDDMHPSSFDSVIYSDGGPGSVLLGDRIVWKVYQAIRNSNSSSGNNWQNTLLIITFDEHGGCYDHVVPPSATQPNTAEFNNKGVGEAGFDFKRLGCRVPMVMVSAHIAENTIVNTRDASLLLPADDATEVGPDITRATSGHRAAVY